MNASHCLPGAVLLCMANLATALELPVGAGRFNVPAASIKEIRFRSTLRQQ